MWPSLPPSVPPYLPPLPFVSQNANRIVVHSSHESAHVADQSHLAHLLATLVREYVNACPGRECRWGGQGNVMWRVSASRPMWGENPGRSAGSLPPLLRIYRASEKTNHSVLPVVRSEILTKALCIFFAWFISDNRKGKKKIINKSMFIPHRFLLPSLDIT